MARDANSVEDQSRRQQGVFVFVHTKNNAIREDNRRAAGGVDVRPLPHEVKFWVPDNAQQRPTMYMDGDRAKTLQAVRGALQRLRVRHGVTPREIELANRIEPVVE